MPGKTKAHRPSPTIATLVTQLSVAFFIYLEAENVIKTTQSQIYHVQHRQCFSSGKKQQETKSPTYSNSGKDSTDSQNGGLIFFPCESRADLKLESSFSTN